MLVFSPSRVAATALAILGSLVATSAWAGPHLQTIPPLDNPQYTTVGGVVPHPTADTIPYWGFAATDPTNGVTYPITMVGADPAENSTTVVPSEIIPLRVTFDANGGYPLDGTGRVDATIASPVFSDYTYPARMAARDNGQYGDVFMRAQFDALRTDYHVKLAGPDVLPTQTIHVPLQDGVAFRLTTGSVVGLVDVNWFVTQLQNLMGALQIDPGSLPMFLTDNVLLYGGSIDNCCIIGFHGASQLTGYGWGVLNTNGAAPVNTWIYSAYVTPGTFTADGIQDIHALGHEVAEWLDDPFIDNAVQPWLTPTAPQYGCTGALETGDPVVGIWFPLPGNPDPSPYADGVWHPEDEVYWTWFLRQSPSSAYNGYYTFMGPYNPYPGFQVPATGCD